MEGKIDSLIKSLSEIKSSHNKVVEMLNVQSDKISSLTIKVKDFISNTSKINC